jgi:hypothetical protein
LEDVSRRTLGEDPVLSFSPPFVAYLWTVEDESSFLPDDLKAILPTRPDKGAAVFSSDR